MDQVAQHCSAELDAYTQCVESIRSSGRSLCRDEGSAHRLRSETVCRSLSFFPRPHPQALVQQLRLSHTSLSRFHPNAQFWYGE